MNNIDIYAPRLEMGFELDVQAEKSKEVSHANALAPLDAPTSGESKLTIQQIVRMLNELAKESSALATERALKSLESRKSEIDTNLKKDLEKLEEEEHRVNKANKASFWGRLFGAIATIASLVMGPQAFLIVTAITLALKAVNEGLKAAGLDDDIRSKVMFIANTALAVATIAYGSGAGKLASKGGAKAAKTATNFEKGASYVSSGASMMSSGANIIQADNKIALAKFTRGYEIFKAEFERSAERLDAATNREGQSIQKNAEETIERNRNLRQLLTS
ncbi:hypothetical protein ACNO7T_22910 [Vibrio campbellii]